jgi:ParB-like chromosome segregation protein Spo0J
MEHLTGLIAELSKLGVDDRIAALNAIKIALHEISPMKNEPVDCVIWVKNELVEANDYNPNSVAPPEMGLLTHSIEYDGYTQPIVTLQEKSVYTVVDGFHRNRVGKECKPIKDRIYGYLPITTIRSDREDRGDRISATIRHNRARGKHRVDAMSDIVIELKRRNWSDQKIGKELGMEPDEVLRLAQITGLREAFKDKEFSQAWEPKDQSD